MTADPFAVGQRVVVRNAFGDLLPAVVAPLPRNFRPKRGPWKGSDAVTDHGQFVKAWVRVHRNGKDGPPTPWPLDAIFTELPR